MTAAASPTADLDPPKVVTRSTHMLTASWVVHWLGLFVFTLPLKLFLKNHFQLDADHVAKILFLAGLPFSLKPFFAWIGDSFAVGGYRRRSWTIVGAFLGAISFLALLPGSKSTDYYVVCIFLAEAGYVFVSCSLGGLMVEFGTRNRVLGILSSYRGAINQGVNVAVGPLAGYLATCWIGWTWMTSALCALGNAALIFGIPDRKYRPENVGSSQLAVGGPELPEAGGGSCFPTNPPREVKAPKRSPGTIFLGQMKSLFSSKPYWFTLCATALIMCAPGFGTPLTFYQQDTLKLSDIQIGTLTMFNGIGGLLMGLLCVKLARRLSVGRLFVVTTVVNAVGTIAYVGYHSFGVASFIEPLGGFVSAGTTVAIFTMAGHATPRGIEGLGYSLVMAVNNFVFSFGDVIGSKLTSQFHIPFWQLVLLNAGTTLLALVVFPFMPKSLKDAKDVPFAVPTESKSQSGHVVDI